MPESSHRFLEPAGWPKPKGYANGVATAGGLVFLGGIIGWNADQEFETDDFVGQAEQIFKSIVTLLQEAGGGPEHLVRMTWYVTEKKEYLARSRDLGRAYQDILGRHYPAMALVEVADLVEDRAKLEIEATAVISQT